VSVQPRWALAVAGVLLTACGGDDGSGGSDDPGGSEAVESVAPTVAPEPTTVWVGDSESSALVRVDPATRATEEIAVGQGPWKVDYVDGSLWVRTPQVQRLDPATGQPTDVLFEEVAVHDFLVDGDGVWMSLQDSPKLVRYDLASGQPEDEVQLPSEDLDLEDMTLHGGFVVAVNSYDATAVRIDLGNGQVAETYNPDEIIWDTQVVGDSLWVAHYGGLVELDAETFEQRQTVQGVEAAYALGVDETGQVWVGLDEMVGTINESGQFEPAATVSDGKGSGSVSDIELSAESVWITHSDVGLVRLDRATKQLDEPIPLAGAGAFAPTFDIALQ
jgi:streptogramin lyase